MEPSAIIYSYRNSLPSEALHDLKQYFAFKLKKLSEDIIADENLGFRNSVTEALLNDFSLADIKLVRELFHAELDCERTIWRHDNLYQLSFYLYSLGQMEDAFLLYEAKYGLGHMDASTMQDRYSITVGHEPNEVIKYVKSRFQDAPDLKNDYPQLVDELQSIIDDPDYESIADYSKFIRGYFLGHSNIAGSGTLH
ncbi:hypothetical protein GO755_12100 [Spirosoma sp. HMF4905]|uniref:DUF4375 domain-containing protein n=1 Tax=Spirosoma arboris TaxID=2682092 RepID=A0A7K1SAJ8_9BACT|nr:hypothetical protein [Spirosoma arboris]MVM30775.1 hypothetical protein [Spirosoma arboris]